MRVTRLLRRRLGAHPVALATIVLSMFTVMLVVVSLQLIVGRIVDAGVGNVLSADVGQRSVAVRASVDDADAARVDATVRSHLERLGPRTQVSTVGVATVRGIVGRGATDRAQVAQADRLEDAAELIAGAWPQPAAGSSGRSVQQATVPESAATALNLGVGDVVRLPDLVSTQRAPLSLRISGIFRIRDEQSPVWADLPLAASGVARGSDYTTYGPFMVREVGPGEVGGAMNMVWRAVPALAQVTPDSLHAQQRRVSKVIGSVAGAIGATVDGGPARLAPGAETADNASVESGLVPLLEDAAALSARIDAALLTPAVLLVVLGLVALVVAAGLLASLRAPENRLIRTRGASGSQLALMSGLEAGAIACASALAALILAPWVVGSINDPDPPYLDEVFGVRALGAAALMVALAVMVVVATTVRHGRIHGLDSSGRSNGAGWRMLASSGLDLVLIAIGVLAAVQLRRYSASPKGTIDPLTTAAPALVIGGLALLALRVLPVLTGRLSMLTSRSHRLVVTWAGWQLARRLAAQGGTILLVLMAVAMGDLALAHGATSARMFADQEAARVGAPVRVDQAYLRVPDAYAGSIYDRAAGGSDRVSPVLRASFDLGNATGADLLALDASTAGRVLHPRADTLAGQDWTALMRILAKGRDLTEGIEVPGRPRTLSVVASIGDPGRPSDSNPVPAQAPASLLVRDGRGLVSALPLGSLGPRPARLTATLTATGPATGPNTGPGPTWPLSIIGLSVNPAGTSTTGEAPDPTIRLTGMLADGHRLDGFERFTQHEGPQGPVLGIAPRAKPAPAVLTRALAAAGKVKVGDTVHAGLPGGSLNFVVAAIVDTIPTAHTPGLALVADLPTLQADADSAGGAMRAATTELVPGEWWLAPADPAAAVKALRADKVLVGEVLSLGEAVAERESDPVNVGMRTSMWLVTAAALSLAALGFAAATVAHRGARRRENVVLLSLGMPWRSLRTSMLWERILVVAAAVIAGSLIGWVSSLVIVPVLVGSDGVRAVPPVRLDVSVLGALGMALAVLALLSAVAAVVLSRHSADLAAELRQVEP